MSAKVFLGRLGHWLYCQLIFRPWAMIYQFCWERRFRDVMLPFFHNTEMLGLQLTKLAYRYDGMRELGDAASSPQAVWALYKLGLPAGDCEDISDFAACCTEASIKAGVWDDPVWFGSMLLCVGWLDAKGKMGGHGVSLLIGAKDGTVLHSYQDYDRPSPGYSLSVEGVVDRVCLDYAGKGYTSLGWAIFQPGTLKLMRCSWK